MWIHIDNNGIPADITDDDGNVVGSLISYTLDWDSQYGYRAEFHLVIEDEQGWMQTVHRSLVSGDQA